MPMLSRRLFLGVGAAAVAGCGSRSQEVVVYCALDREFAEPILKSFEQATSVRVRASYDTESTKSVGLAESLQRERQRPRCDVFWNNEILNTMRLAKAGILAPYASPTGRQFPQQWRSADDSWFGFAARGRVLLVNHAKLGGEKEPATLDDLTHPAWKGKIGIAKPLFGTTASQVACLFAVWGADRTRDWLRRLKANDVRILAGNKQAATEVGAGSLICGLTDTDDAAEEIEAHRPVRQVFLDQAEGGLGSLVLPNTVALIQGAPRPEAGRRLLDYLLTPAVERTLAASASRQIPLHPGVVAVDAPRPKHLMGVDFAKASSLWDEAMRTVKAEFTV